MFVLTRPQREYLLERFALEEACATAHSHVWARRSYAPMYVHDAELTSLRERIHALLPDYVIVFDVVFDSLGNEVDWHVDHESLGPFSVPHRRRAVRDHHFLSLHFNLTPDGGALVTFPAVHLSCAYFWIVTTFGIFSWAYRLVAALTRPLLARWGVYHDTTPGCGNLFDNTRLHAVTRGAARTSYVVRLARRGVRLTRASVEEGIARSAACRAFEPLRHVVRDHPSVAVEDVAWAETFRASHRAGAD